MYYMEEYTLDDNLVVVLYELFQDNTYLIIELFQNLQKINNYRIGVDKYIEKMEERIIENINISLSKEEAVDLVSTRIANDIIPVLNWLGIEVSEEYTIFQLIDLINCLVLLFSLDSMGLCDIINILESRNDTDDNVEVLTMIISNFSRYTESEIFDLIKDVKETFFNKIETYIEHINNNETNDQAIKFMVITDELNKRFKYTFIDTTILQYFKENGYIEYEFNEKLELISHIIKAYIEYNKISSADVHIDLPYEIALNIFLYNYLSKDKPLINIDFYYNHQGLLSEIPDMYIDKIGKELEGMINGNFK